MGPYSVSTLMVSLSAISRSSCLTLTPRVDVWVKKAAEIRSKSSFGAMAERIIPGRFFFIWMGVVQTSRAPLLKRTWMAWPISSPVMSSRFVSIRTTSDWCLTPMFAAVCSIEAVWSVDCPSHMPTTLGGESLFRVPAPYPTVSMVMLEGVNWANEAMIAAPVGVMLSPAGGCVAEIRTGIWWFLMMAMVAGAMDAFWPWLLDDMPVDAGNGDA